MLTVLSCGASKHEPTDTGLQAYALPATPQQTTFPLKSLTFFSIIVFRMFCRTTVICVVNSDLKKAKKTREHFRAIIFHNFRRGLSRQECIDELK